jgi:hypothetical protein
MGDGRPLFVRDDDSDGFFLVKTASSFALKYPLPLPGYFGRKIPDFNSLRRVGVCKIFLTNRLRTKYFLSMS